MVSSTSRVSHWNDSSIGRSVTSRSLSLVSISSVIFSLREWSMFSSILSWSCSLVWRSCCLVLMRPVSLARISSLLSRYSRRSSTRRLFTVCTSSSKRELIATSTGSITTAAGSGNLSAILFARIGCLYQLCTRNGVSGWRVYL